MTTTAETVRRWWRAFTAWRRDRPFWGGVLTIAGAVELLVLTAAPLQIMLIAGLAGIGTLVIAAMLIALAVISWTHTHLRVICGVFTVILALASFAVSNLGGFLLGLLLALIGGSLIFAWQPGEPTDGEPAPDETETATGPNPAPPSEERGPRPEPTDEFPRRAVTALACVLAVLAVTLIAATPAAAHPGHAADPVLPCPSWWPWCEDGEPTDPDDPGDDELDEPGDDGPEQPVEPDGECDESQLPARPPELGTKAAETVARALAACLALPGTSQTGNRNLPTVSTTHPVLEAEVMAMSGMDSGGVVDVPTAEGTEPALEFTMDTLELTDMDQSAGIGGTDARLHVINMGSTAVLSDDVRLYVQRMEGLIFGVVPIVLTAETPLPPIPVPYLVVTQAKVDTVYTRAGRVDLPDLEEPTR